MGGIEGGQLAAGFVLAGFLEDRDDDNGPQRHYMPAFIATRAIRP